MSTDDAPHCESCGHAKKSHRYGGANGNGSYVFHSSCKKADCGCEQYTHPEKGVVR